MYTTVDFSARTKQKKGLDIVADATKITIGPKGRNVAVKQGSTLIRANDAGTIARNIHLMDQTEDIGADTIRQVIQTTSQELGGGRTAAALLTQAIVEEGIKLVDKGMNVNLVKKGMRMALADATEGLKSIAKPVTSQEELTQVATIATEDEELGKVISDVVYKVGKDCVVTVEDSQTFDITTEIVEGMKFDKGYISPWMVTDTKRMEAVHTEAPILITDKKISFYKDIFPVIKACNDSGVNSLVLICEDLDGDALMQTNIMLRGQIFNLLAVKIPGFSDKKEWLDDMALATGATIVSDTTGVKIEMPADLKQKIEMPVYIGRVNKIISTKDTTVLVGSQSVKDKVEELSALKETVKTPYEKDKLEKRIAILSGSVAVIKVGAPTEDELKYLKLKIEDGIRESKLALEEGIVPGGDVAILNAIKAKIKEKLNFNTPEEFAGYSTIVKAMGAPFKQIVRNAQGEPEVMLAIVMENKSTTLGYNANTNKIEEDMFKAGIIDAAKLSRRVLEIAISAAIMFLSSMDTSITEDQELTN